MLQQHRHYLLLIVVSIVFSIIQCSTVAYKDANNDATNRKSYCVGSTDGFNRVAYSGNFDILRRQYGGCKIVFGHVIISHVDKSRIANLTDDEMKKALSFLDGIEQITGSLVIFKTELKSISFKNLKVIWGDELLDGMALTVDNNYQLKNLSFPSLRSIERGSIALNVLPYLCHWQKTVSMYEILGKNYSQRVFTRMLGYNCNKEPEPKCHPKCNGKCWSSGPNDCQIVYRKNCPKDCRSGMCHVTEFNETICCDEACAAGCEGKGSDHCVACKRLYQDGRCVDRCNGLTSYDVVKMMVVPHKNPRYAHNRFCVARCPSSTYIENENCVHRCSPGLYYDTSVMPYTCKPCKNGICPKRCIIEQAITGENIERLRNCTTIEGHLYLAPHSFEPTFSATLNKTVKLTVDKLEILSSVRVVTDYVEVSVLHHPVKNLSFLRNLEVIIGQKLRVKFALKIFANYHLQYLGLTALKKISGGRVFILGNPKLCFVDTLNETWNSIVLEEPEPVYQKYKVDKNRNKALCESQAMVCDSTCDQKYGCWGPGNGQCARCENFFDGERCVDQCPSTGYYITGTNCSRCAPECVSCHGPLDTDCNKCKNVILHQESGYQCLSKCPISHYNRNGICLKCHKACYSFGCSGSGEFAGKGGCNKCKYAVELEKGVIRCLAALDDPNAVCRDNSFANYFIHVESSKYIQSYKCSKCPDECSSCTGFGTDTVKHECICNSYKTFDIENRTYCTNGCKDGTYLVQERTAESVGVCRQCNELCDLSYNCTGNQPSDCYHCKHAAIIKNKKTSLS